MENIDIDKDILENIDIDINIDKEILENIDIDIDIDKDILENIDIDKEILENIEQGYLGVKVEEASQPGDLLPVINLVPEAPYHDVACQEGNDHHTRPCWMSFYQHLLVRDICEACFVGGPFPGPVVPNCVPSKFFKVAVRMVFGSQSKFDDESPIRVDIGGWQGDVDRSNQEGFLPLLQCSSARHGCKRIDKFFWIGFQSQCG